MTVPRYDVALSFAGEDRAHAEKLAEALRQRGVRVFYDRYEEATLWGKNLYTHLSDVYQNQARYCVIFLSQHYKEKVWTNHEREAAQARALREHEEYILPIRLDDAEIPAILPTIAYLRWPPHTAESTADAVIAKLQVADEARHGLPDHAEPDATTSAIPLSQQIPERMGHARRELAAEQARIPRQRLVTLSEMLQAEEDGTTSDVTPAPTFQEEIEERRRQALAAQDAEQANHKALNDALQASADKLMAPLVLEVGIDQTITAEELERSIQSVAEGLSPWWQLTENASVTDGESGQHYRRVILHYHSSPGMERDDVRIFVAEGADSSAPVQIWRRYA